MRHSQAPAGAVKVPGKLGVHRPAARNRHGQADPSARSELTGGKPLDQLVCDRIEVLPYVVRLRAHVERGVALAQDERGLPARRNSAEGVPDVARDQAEPAGSTASATATEW